ncbi:MAG: hypothetical protein EOP83_17330 [Verrucomicrobiaceae bacterium]|nr:MAG: hypothetical protein EOP83_17330 [Verrucomicrobiaceae bacterium]
MKLEHRDTALRLREHFQAQRVDPAVGVGSTFGTSRILDSTVGPALYVYISEAEMQRIRAIDEFEGIPVIYRVGEARVNGTKAGKW